MPDDYRHTQRATLILVAMFAVIVGIGAGALASRPLSWPIAALIGFFGAVAWLFHSLTIRVTPDTIRWHFGPGILHWSRPLSEVASAARGRSHWWNGWGIRLTGYGWLYNVSGFDVVVVTLKSGKRFGLGTDDPDGLLAAIRDGLRSSS